MPRSLLTPFCLAALLGTAAVVSAQETADDAQTPTAAPDFEGALAVLDSDLGDDADWQADLGQRLSVCLRPLYPDSPNHEDVLLAIEVDAEGKPGAPYLLEPKPDEATLAHLRQLFRAEAAIFDCAPLKLTDGRALPPVLSLAASRDTLVPLDDEELAERLPAEPTTAQDEALLELSRNDRRELQTRLRLAGHDPGSADGVFGPRTRTAVAEWQEANDLPASGYLDARQHDRLITETETSFAEWQENQPQRTTTQRSRFYRGSDGCLRDRYGRRVQGQSLRCDLRGLFGQF